AGGDHAERAAFKSYGANLGLAFQLIDDVLDYGGNSAELGKEAGDDFRAGKITLPIVLAYRRGSEQAGALWRRALEGDGIGADAPGGPIGLMRSRRALEGPAERGRRFGAVARDALAPCPEPAHRAARLGAVDFGIARAY